MHDLQKVQPRFFLKNLFAFFCGFSYCIKKKNEERKTQKELSPFIIDSMTSISWFTYKILIFAML